MFGIDKILGGIGLIGISISNAWSAHKNRQSSAIVAQENRKSSEIISQENRKHSERMQLAQMKVSVLQQQNTQNLQKELAQYNFENAKEIEAFRQSVSMAINQNNLNLQRELAQLNFKNTRELEEFRQSVNIALNQKNLDFQKWRFEQEKQLQYEMLMLGQDFQREYLQSQHQNSLEQIRERIRIDQSPIINLAADLLENSYTNGVMPLKILLSPPILDYDSHRPQSSGTSYESFLAEEIRQFLHQGYLNSNQYPVQLLDKAWSSKRTGGGSAVHALYAQLKSIPVLVLESEIVGDELNLRVGYWSGGNAPLTESSILSRFPFQDLLYEAAKKRALAWKETRQKLQALGKTEEYLQKMGGINELNLQVLETELAEKAELEQHGIDISEFPLNKDYKISDKDYKNFYEFLAVWHCLLIGVFADTLFFSRSWQNTFLLPTLFPYLLDKYQNNQFPVEFWQTAITEIVKTYDGLYTSLESECSRWLPEMKMHFAQELIELPNEYHYLALEQANSAVASWLKSNKVLSDKVFDVNNDEDCQLLKRIVYREDEPFFRSLQELVEKIGDETAIDTSKREAINSLLVGWQFLNRWGDIPNLPKLEKSENPTDSLFEQALELSNLGKHEETVACYDQLLEIEPDNYYAWFNRGGSLLLLGKYEEAIASYDKAIQIEPDSYTAWWSKAGILLDSCNEYEKALVAYDKALQIKPDEAFAWMKRGDIYAHLENYEKAILSYDKALEFEIDKTFLTMPSDWKALVWAKLGDIYAQLENYEEAVSSYNQVLHLRFDNADAQILINTRWKANIWLKQGKSLWSLGKHEEAVASYDQAIQLNPENCDTWQQRGLALESLGKYEEAIISISKGIQINPQSVIGYFCRGLVYEELEAFDKAVSDYSQAIHINPNFIPAYANRVIIYFNLKQYELAISDYSQLICFDHEISKNYLRRGLVYELLQEHELAIDDYSKSLAINPNDAFVYFYRGIAYQNSSLVENQYIDRNRIQNAIKDYTQAIILNPENSHAYFNRGGCYHMIKEMKKAAESFQQAAKLYQVKGETEDYNKVMEILNNDQDIVLALLS